MSTHGLRLVALTKAIICSVKTFFQEIHIHCLLLVHTVFTQALEGGNVRITEETQVPAKSLVPVAAGKKHPSSPLFTVQILGKMQ